MSPSESEYLATHGPARHARTSAKIDACMRASHAVDLKRCRCDVDKQCFWHLLAVTRAERRFERGRP